MTSTRAAQHIIAAAVFLPSAFSSGAFAAAVPVADQAAIQAAYTQINAAFTRHDLDRFMTYFTPDYKVVDENSRTFNKAQTRRQYADQLKQVKTMNSRFTVQNFTAVPSGVEAEMKLHTQGIGEKRVLFMKFKGTYADDLWVRDLWVQTPDGWRIKSRKTLADKLVTHPG